MDMGTCGGVVVTGVDTVECGEPLSSGGVGWW